MTKRVTLRNSGRSPLDVSWDPLPAPFAAPELPAVVPSGEIDLEVRFSPTAAGDAAATLVGHVPGVGDLKLGLHGQGAAIPACPLPVACQAVHFELSTGRCVETTLADGTACDPHSVCVTEATCRQGRCVGTAVGCDDGNACTLDVCAALTGCEHLPAEPCPGAGPCRVGTCDPKTGCGLADAVDGTSCGAARGCDLADVCIGGACTQRDPPDGFLCASSSPCQAAGRCNGSVCEQPAATALGQTWWLAAGAAPFEEDGWHDLLLEPAGEVTLSGFFEVPQLRVNTAGSVRAETSARRCMLWNSRLVCADYPGPSTGRVSALDPATGERKWTFDLGVARPDFLAASGAGHLFMARLAAMGSDHLAAIFEAFPAGALADTQCRLYFLVVLDVAGAMVSATRLEDPALSLCNHPHPYGIAADALGQLYLAFSPSSVGNAPLVPQTPTLLMAFTPTGLVRWTRSESFAGGELAISEGRLYPENSARAYLTASGTPVPFPAPGPLGRVVASHQRVVRAPASGATALEAFDPDGKSVWVSKVAGGASYATDLLKLVSFQPTSDAPVELQVLGFTQQGQQVSLSAVDFLQGTPRWSCPVGAAGGQVPQLAEVARGVLAWMEGSETCGHCDPPFAGSAASFRTFSVPGIGPARGSWTGVFSGAGHDNLERPPRVRGE